MKTKINFITILFVLVIFSCSTEHSLVILTTNDTHSRVLPTADGKGGYSNRSGVIDTIRAKHKSVLLLDDGDFLQGTIFFSFFKGQVEVEAMNFMKYDAATLGNHEFDNGIDTLAKYLSKTNFPILCANYDVSGTALQSIVKPYTIIYKDKIKIGVFGLGISPNNLISEDNFKGIKWLNPEITANQIAAKLRNEEKCDLVICISHLGVDKSSQFSDFTLAENTQNIDIICGGHSHKMINQKVKNKLGKSVQIIQSGKNGEDLGRIDVVIKK